MLHLRLILLGITVIGTIGIAVYQHYSAEKRQKRRSYSFEQGQSSHSVETDSSPPSWNIKRMTEDSADNCSICLSEIINIEHKFLSCGHGFHTKCIQLWYYKNGRKSCPNCRTVEPF